MRFSNRFITVTILVLASAVLSGCVVRPLGWGHRGGHGYSGGHGDHHSDYYRGSYDQGREGRRGRR